MKAVLDENFLEAEGKKVLFYHTDTDGICSAALFTKFFPGFMTVPLEGPVLDRRLMKSLVEMKPGLLVLLDLPMDQEADKLEKLMNTSLNTRILMIDHHVPEKDMNSQRFVHINPRLEREIYIPASVLVYRLFRDLGKDIEKFIWIAAVGVIGDYAFRDCQDILDECAKRYPKACAGGRGKAKIYDIARNLMSTVIYQGNKGAGHSLEIMRSAEGYKDVTENRYFITCNDRVEREIDKAVAEFRKKAKEYPNLGLFVYRIDNRLNIASSVSTKLSERNPDKIIFVVKQSKQMMKISARYQEARAEGINLNDLLKKAVKGIGTGGGHIRAAGAVVPKKDWPEFERRVMKLIEDLTITS
ncbi:MAG: DHH family phosphoesterase [Candidatus Aenigmatarchaeota archaeon]|nr:MAG: DHH family phosphoesterase [Candidatus Aenigmarchaeota archaeon]